MTIRFIFTLGLAMKLRPGAYESYKLAHDQLWPELAEGMRANQVSMAICETDPYPPKSYRITPNRLLK